MFALHETTRRGLCRLGFFFFCVMPLGVIGAASAVISSDTWRSHHEHQLSQRLGMNVSVERVLHTEPQGIRYEGLTIVDPETQAPLVRAKSLTISRHDQTVFVAAEVPEIYTARLDELQPLLTRELKLGKPGERIWASTSRLILHLTRNRQLAVENVSADFNYSKTNASALVRFQPIDQQSKEPVELWIERNRQTNPPEVAVQLITGDESTLPCQLAAPFLPACADLGEDCRFRGGFLATHSTKGWTGRALGVFTNVDLASLVSRQFPHHLSGTATLTIDNARFTGNRIEQIDGSVFSGGGTIHHALAERFCRECRLAGEHVDDRFGDRHPYSELAFGFALDSRGLLIAGQCKSAKQPGAVLVDRYAATIQEPTPAARLPLDTLETLFHQSRATLLSVLPQQTATTPRR